MLGMGSWNEMSAVEKYIVLLSIAWVCWLVYEFCVLVIFRQ